MIGKTGDAKEVSERSNEKEELETELLRLYDKRGNLDVTKVVQNLNKNIKNLESVVSTNEKFPLKVTYKNGNEYQIKSDGEINILSEDGYFNGISCKDFEVFQIIF